MKKILLLFLCVLSFNAIHADVTWNLSDDGTLTISGTGKMQNYDLNWKTVPWYSQQKQIKKVVIEDGVTTIGSYAFDHCSSLTSVTIPNSVTWIGEHAFWECNNLTSITIPNSVTTIGNSAFLQCKNLTSITISNSVTSIGKSAFAECSGLTSITIPNSVTIIGDAAFYKCTSLTSVTIPNSVTSIGERAFYGCSGLTGSLIIPNSVTSIGSDAFFCNSPRLVSIKVEDGNTYYDSRNNCNAIIETQSNTLLTGCKNTIIPNSVKSIGNNAFYGCSGLKAITIPNSVTSIGSQVFCGCSNLTSISISNSVTDIKEFTFYNCSKLASVNIPNSVTTIGNSAFYYCSSLTSIAIPNSVTSIGDNAFYHCSGLTSVTIPNSVTTIGNSTFYGCSSVSSITIPESVTSIGTRAFEFCSITSITIPESVVSIGSSAFSYCSHLTSITSEAKNPPYCYDKCFYYVDKSIPVYVPANSINAYKDAEGWGDFTNFQPLSVDPSLALALTDASPNLTEGYYKNDKVTYTRNNMSVGGYATFCLPFDIDLSQTTDNFSKVYVPLNISLCKPSGSLLLLLDEVNSYSTIKAGQPFVAKCKTTNVTFKNSSEVSFEGTVSNPTSTNVKVYNFDGVSGSLTQKTDVNVKIGGTFSKLTGLDDDYYRAFFTNGSFGPTTSVNPFRMYVYKNDNNSLGSKITSISFDFNEETTGIKELRVSNYKLPVYDLNGRAVNASNLKSGIYIINGKKYIK